MGANNCICKDLSSSKNQNSKTSGNTSVTLSSLSLNFQTLTSKSSKRSTRMRNKVKRSKKCEKEDKKEDLSGSERYRIFETYKDDSGLWRDSTHFAEAKIQEKLGIRVSNDDVKDYYKIKRTLGEGNYAVVKQGHSLAHPNFKVAIKVYNLDCCKTDKLSILREITALSTFDHPNLVKVHEVFKNENKLYLICDLVQGMELYDFILEGNKLSEDDIKIVIQQILRVMKYAHSKNIMHRDLKPENIIIDKESLQIKVIDFGSSSYFSRTAMAKTCLGTPFYIAPEVLKGEYGKEADIWSIGIITYLMLTTCPPFQDEDFQVIYQKIMHEPTPFIRSQWTNLSLNSMKFVKQLLVKDPKERMSLDDAFSHPWMDGVEEELCEVNYAIFKKIINRSQPNILKQEILHLCSSQINSKLLQKWNKLYHQIYSNKMMMGNLQKLFDIYKQTVSLSDLERTSEYIKVLSKLSLSSDNFISYSDFLSTVVDFNKDVSFFTPSSLLAHMGIASKEFMTLEKVQKYAERRNYSSESGELLYNQLQELLSEDEEISPQQTQNMSVDTFLEDRDSGIRSDEERDFYNWSMTGA